MEVVMITICLTITFVAIIALVITHSQQKYKILQVRIEEALKNIEYFLEKKEENLKSAIPIIKKSNKKKYEKEEILPSLIKNQNIKQTLYEQDESLRKNLKELTQLLDIDETLTKIKELNEIYYSSIEIENDLNASKKYYNKIAKKIDDEFKKFPQKILKKVLKYQKLERFNTKKEETLEILKEKETKKEEPNVQKDKKKRKEKKEKTKKEKPKKEKEKKKKTFQE